MKQYNAVLFTLCVGGAIFLWGFTKGCEKLKQNEEIVIEEQIPQDKPKEQIIKWDEVEMNVSAYCACEKCCEQYADGITASRHKIEPGDAFVAAPHKYKFGTEMIIPGYNNGESVKVEDVGGAIKGNKLDVYFSTHETALQWGRQYLTVKVRR